MASDTNAKDVVLLERVGTSVCSPSLTPKNTVTLEIGKEAYDTPIVYRLSNNRDQLLRNRADVPKKYE
jgi:hypothetical protein